MTYYNLSAIMNVNTTAEMVQNINSELTNYWWGLLVVVGAFFIIFVTMSYYSPQGGLLMASFFSSVISGLMYNAQLVSFVVFIFSIIATFISTALYFFLSDKT